jgi:hypothetical protein
MGNVVDTLEYVKELRAAGVPEQQAEAQAKALSKAVSEQLVSKEHFDYTIDKQNVEFSHRMEQLEQRLTIRMGGMIAAAIAALAAIMRMH